MAPLGSWASVSPGRGEGTFDTRETTFEYAAAAYRCLELVASNLASVPLTVLMNGEARDDHDIARLWNDGAAGDSLSARVIRQTMFGKLEHVGESFAFVDRGPTGDGKAQSITPLYDPVEVITGPGERGIDEVILGFIVRTAKGRVPLLPSEVLWLRYPHPLKRWAALAPWRAALYAVEVDGLARAWQRGEFENGARPSSLINLGDVPDEVYTRAVQMIRSRTEGPSNAGKSMIIRTQPNSTSTIKPTVEHLSLTPAEMSYLESRVANVDEVCMAFGVKPDLLRAGATYENVAASKSALWSDTLLAKLDVCASELDRQLLPGLDEQGAWDLSAIDALREAQDSITQRVVNAMYPELFTIDEGRAAMGLEPLPGGLGQYTLTPYRLRASNIGNAETLVLPDDGTRGQRAPRLLRHGGALHMHRRHTAPTLEQRTVTVPGIPEGATTAVVTHVDSETGQQRTAQLEATGTRAKRKSSAPSPTSVLATYDKHERVGRRLVKKLADRQAKAVKREINAATRRDPGWAVQWRADLTAEVEAGRLAVIDLPDGTRVARPVGVTRAGVSMRIYDTTFWEKETAEALEPFVDHVWSDGGQRAADQFDLTWSQLNPKVLDKMHARLGDLSEKMTETTRQAIEARILDEGIEEGESIDKLANRIMDVFDDMGSRRAETIARTETVGGYNAAAHEVMEEADIEFERVWLATMDARTRESHAALNGRRLRDPDELWPNDCLFPGDPNGPADETINCRCVELFEEVEE